MKHHFGDHLDRDGDYWSIVPDADRFKYAVNDTQLKGNKISIVTVTKKTDNWQTIFKHPHIEELTLNNPSHEQLEAVANLWRLKRLRITHARPKNIEFMSSLVHMEELVLEYVSGFSDLSPLGGLPKLKSIHFENLRQVSDFGGLSGLCSLRYLSIDGTLDWKQPILNFEFLKGLPNLEIFRMGQVINKTPSPAALLPALSLKKLKAIRVTWTMLQAEDYALLEVGLPHVDGTQIGPYTIFPYSTLPLPKDDIRWRLSDDVIKENHKDVYIYYDGTRHIDDPNDTWVNFTGKKSGITKVGSKNEKARCDAFTRKYDVMKVNAQKLIDELKA